MQGVKTWSTAAPLLAAVVGLSAGVLLAAPAAADVNDDVVRSLEIEAELDPTGSLHITETYAWDFGDRDGLGFYRNILQRMDWEPEPSMVRVLDIEEITVSSPSQAPAQWWVERDDEYLELVIGAPDGSEETRSGVQTYVLSYTIDGAVNAIRDQDVSDQDELYWNATGHETLVTMEEVSVSVTGPEEVTSAACFSGPIGSEQECSTHDEAGATVTFADGPLEPGAGLTVALAYPPGTFTEPGPILQDRVIASLGGDRELTATQQSVARVTDPVVSALVTFWPLTLIAVLAAMAAGVWSRRHLHRDYQFSGLTPGVIPPAGQQDQHPSERLSRELPPTVAFTPPDGLSPAEVSYLWHKGERSEQLSATLTDLATRGHLVISEAQADSRGRASDWTLTRATPPGQDAAALKAHEEHLLHALFTTVTTDEEPTGEGPARRAEGTVALSSLDEEFAEEALAFNERVSSLVTDRGLLSGAAHVSARESGLASAAKLFAPAIALLLLLAAVNLAVPVIPPSAVALAIATAALLGLWLVIHLLVTVTASPRTPVGRALYEQARGFKLYLETAEAEQIRFEEGIDVFSRYLPYAMVFGLAERWAGIFERLQAEGRYEPDTSWYVAHQTGGTLPLAVLATSMSSFSDSAGSTLTSTPGGSGGSAFSSGGGFSGGGVGGGGVGGR